MTEVRPWIPFIKMSRMRIETWALGPYNVVSSVKSFHVIKQEMLDGRFFRSTHEICYCNPRGNRQDLLYKSVCPSADPSAFHGSSLFIFLNALHRSPRLRRADKAAACRSQSENHGEPGSFWLCPASKRGYVYTVTYKMYNCMKVKRHGGDRSVHFLFARWW